MKRIFYKYDKPVSSITFFYKEGNNVEVVERYMSTSENYNVDDEDADDDLDYIEGSFTYNESEISALAVIEEFINDNQGQL